MGLFESLRRWRRGPSGARASSDDRSVYGNFWFEPTGLRTFSGVRVTATSALALPTVFACVRVLAESFAVMPFRLYQPKSSGGRSRNTKHWLYRLIAKRPNPFQTPYEWRLMLQGHLALRGNAFCQITTDQAGAIRELLPLHPDRMSAEILPNGSYRYRYTDQLGRTTYFARTEIWHLRGLSSDGIMGLNPIEIAREAVGEGLAMQSYASRFFANDAKPGGGWIEYPGRFADKATKQTFRDSWQEMQGGANRGKVAVLESGMKFHELGLNNTDAQFIEARGYKVGDIARLFRVPPHKIGDLSKATFSNIEQQSIEFWTDTMLPYAELWESSIEFFLLGPDDELELDPEFDMDRMMRGDSVARANYYASRTQWGSITPNEVREREGDDPIDGLDKPLRPLNMVPVGDDGSTIVPPPGPAPTPAPAPAPVDGADARRADVLAMGEARMRALIASNAQRMARRIINGQLPSPELLAEALAVPTERAAEWLDAVAATPMQADAIAPSLELLANIGPTT